MRPHPKQTTADQHFIISFFIQISAAFIKKKFLTSCFSSITNKTCLTRSIGRPCGNVGAHIYNQIFKFVLSDTHTHNQCYREEASLLLQHSWQHFVKTITAQVWGGGGEMCQPIVIKWSNGYLLFYGTYFKNQVNHSLYHISRVRILLFMWVSIWSIQRLKLHNEVLEF